MSGSKLYQLWNFCEPLLSVREPTHTPVILLLGINKWNVSISKYKN